MSQILDCTMREGEQQAGVRFSLEDKARILRLLEQLGIAIVEVGHPGLSREDAEACAAIASMDRSAQVLMHSRACADEVDAAWQAGADWVGIWASINSTGLNAKFNGRAVEEVTSVCRAAIERAKGHGLKVRFTIEDASRTEWERVRRLGVAAVEAGADRVSLADTVGVLTPERCRALVERARDAIPAELEVHCHDDFGLALANSLAAMEAGADVVDASVLGIGERAGVTDLLQLVMALTELHGDERYQVEHVGALAGAVRRATGFVPDALRPVVGRNAFVHSSAYHARAMRQDSASYEPFSPARIGRRHVLLDSRPEPPRPRLVEELRVGRPFLRESSELRFHRDGPGRRWVLVDRRVDDRAGFYLMAREVRDGATTPDGQGHVDSHRHHCDSALVFLGARGDGSGLRCRVEVDGHAQTLESPATVYVAAGADHSYSYVDGEGTIFNVVLDGDYNSSLTVDSPPWAT